MLIHLYAFMPTNIFPLNRELISRLCSEHLFVILGVDFKKLNTLLKALCISK